MLRPTTRYVARPPALPTSSAPTWSTIAPVDFRASAKALLEAGQPFEAAQALAKGGDKEAGAKLLFREKRFGDAARILMMGVATVEIPARPDAEKKNVERAASYFATGGEHDAAAELYAALGDHESATRCRDRARGRPGPAQPSPVLSGGHPVPATAAPTLGHAEALERQGAFEQAAQIYAQLGARDGVERVAAHLPARAAAAALSMVGSLFRAAQLCLSVDDKLTAYECLVHVSQQDTSYPDACALVVELVWPMRFVDARLLEFLAAWADHPWPSPGDIEALCHVAELRAKLGRVDEARVLFLRILEMSPQYQDARNGVSNLDTAPVVRGVADDNTVDRVFSDAFPSLEVTQGKLAERVADLQTETLIGGRYRLGRKLGRGGMGVVFEAKDEELGESVALKFLLPLDDKAAVQRFKREITMSRRLVHPNIVRVFDLGMQDDLRYVTMELLTGEDLWSRLRRPMDLQLVTDVLMQACRGLHAAHEQGIVHRDVKPANIFIVQSGVVKMMDFGIARDAAAKGLTQAGNFVGTPRYMAPEHFVGDVGPAADLYSLGVTAYEVLCGAPPFEERESLPLMWKHMGEVPVRPRDRKDTIPDELDDLIMALLEKKPERRPKSAAAVADELQRIQGWLVLNAPTIVDDDA